MNVICEEFEIYKTKLKFLVVKKWNSMKNITLKHDLLIQVSNYLMYKYKLK